MPHKCRQGSPTTLPAEWDAGLFLGVSDRRGLVPQSPMAPMRKPRLTWGAWLDVGKTRVGSRAWQMLEVGT